MGLRSVVGSWAVEGGGAALGSRLGEANSGTGLRRQLVQHFHSIRLCGCMSSHPARVGLYLPPRR